MADPTPEQLAARLNPTAATVTTPTDGLFTTGGGSTLWGTNAQGQYAAYDLANIGKQAILAEGGNLNNGNQSTWITKAQQVLKDKYGIDTSTIKDNSTFNPNALWQSNNNAISTTDFNKSGIDAFFSFAGKTPSATNLTQVINNTPNAIATPEQIAQQQKDPNWVSAATPTQKTLGPGGVEITPQSIQQGVQNINQQGITSPTTVLQPGSTDTASVKALQDYLVKTGYMTQAQVNTGYGTYGPQTTAAVKALQAKLGIDNSSGPGYFGPKTIAALQAGNVTSPNTTPGGVTADKLTGGSKTPITIGGVSSDGSYSSSSVIAGAEATSKSIQDYINMLTSPSSADKTKYDALLAQVEAMLPDQGGRGAAQAEAEKQQGVDMLKKSLADVNAQILNKTAQYKALNTDIEGKPITMNSIIGAQAQVQKVMASDIGLLQAQALGLQGQLEAAQDAADRAVDLKYADAKDALDLRLKQLELIGGELDKKDKIRADAIQLYLNDQKQALAVQVANEKDKNSTLLNLLQKYPDAQISMKDTLEQAAAKVKNSKIYQQETRLASSTSTTTKNTLGVEPANVYGNKQALPMSEEASIALEEGGVSTEDIIQLQDMLNQGYTLKQIATQTGMPIETFDLINQYIV